MNEMLSVLGNLYEELENKKIFLMVFKIDAYSETDYTERIEHLMDEIKWPLIPVIEDHKYEDVWTQIKRNASDAYIEGYAPDFIKSIGELYNRYRNYIRRLTNFINDVQNFLKKEVFPPISDNFIRVLLRNCLFENTISNIIQDSHSETGEIISSDQYDSLWRLLNNCSSTKDSLHDEEREMISQIDRIKYHIRKILRRGNLFDYEDESEDESEFYHG